MKLTNIDRIQGERLSKAYQDREVFNLTGAGFTAEYVPVGLSYTPTDDQRFEYILTLEQIDLAQAPAPVWNGPEDGLPPVGTELELQLKVGSTWTVWCPAKVLFCKDNALVFQWAAQEAAHPVTLNQVRWRAIKTAEQLAAEERERAIDEALKLINRTTQVPGDIVRQNILRHAVEALIDQGYRAPVKP